MSKSIKLIKGVEVTPLKRLNESKPATNLKHPDKYVFQGVFTACSTPEHKIVNRNGRVYQKTEFLRHLGYLRDMIKENNGRLLGELDHPEGRFDVQLKEASHMITDLWFDDKTNCVMGRLEVLDTPNGKILKELIDAGFPLYVSSRAAGDVNEKTKEVEIAQIFTYDVVCTPGFKEARLERLDESAMTDNTLKYINEAVSSTKTAKMKDIDVPSEFLNEKLVSKYKSTKVNDVVNPLLESDEDLKVSNFLPIQNTSSQSLKEDDEPEEKPEEKKGDEKEEKKGDEKKGDEKKGDDSEKEETLSDEEKKENRDTIVGIKGLDKDGKNIADEEKGDRSDIVSIKATKKDASKDDESEEKPEEKKEEKKETSEEETNECNSKTNECDANESKKKTEKKDNKKVSNIKAKTDKDVADYQALIDSVTKQESVKESIIRRYPFTAFLTEANFSKFAVLRPKQKKRCADFIEEHDVNSIEAINELWSTPLREEKKLQQNWLKLASQADIDLYTAAPLEIQNAIEESAKYVILETQEDVDMFWQRTGLRQRNAQRMMMEKKMHDFKSNMFANEEYKQNNNLGYDVDWITITENFFKNN